MRKEVYALSIAVIALAIALIGTLSFYQNRQYELVKAIQHKAGQTYLANISSLTTTNTNFRKVLFTGTRSQLVVMDIPPGGDVGEEVHKYIEQTLFFLSGTGKAILEGKESPIVAGDVVVVTPGTEHNFVNTGTSSLKIYTVYSPPNHIEGTLEVTKSIADKNIADEVYGEEFR